MKSAFGMLLCFGVAIVGLASIAWEFFAIPDPATLVIQWSPLFQSLPIVLIAVGLVAIIFTLMRNPTGSKTIAKLSATEKQNQDYGLTLAATDLDAETTLLVDEIEFDDYLEGAPTRSDGKKPKIDVYSEGYTEDIEVPVVSDARVLIEFDRVDEAIEVLKEAFEHKDTNFDVVAMELVTILENEIEDDGITNSRRSALKVVRDDFITKLAEEKEKLSDDVWHYVHMEYPEITGQFMEPTEYDPEDSFEKTKIVGL